MTTTDRTTPDLDAIEARAAHLYEYVEQPEEADVLAGTDVPALVAEAKCLRAELEQFKRGGKELGKIIVFLAELIKDAYVRGEKDPTGALLTLGDYLSNLFEDEGGLPTDDHNRVYRALEDRRKAEAEVEAEVEADRLREESARMRAELSRQLTDNERAFQDGV